MQQDREPRSLHVAYFDFAGEGVAAGPEPEQGPARARDAEDQRAGPGARLMQRDREPQSLHVAFFDFAGEGIAAGPEPEQSPARARDAEDQRAGPGARVMQRDREPRSLHVEFFDFAGEGVAPPPQPFGGFLSLTARRVQGHVDQGPLEALGGLGDQIVAAG